MTRTTTEENESVRHIVFCCRSLKAGDNEQYQSCNRYLLCFEVGTESQTPQRRQDAVSDDFLVHVFAHLLVHLQCRHLITIDVTTLVIVDKLCPLFISFYRHAAYCDIDFAGLDVAQQWNQLFRDGEL